MGFASGTNGEPLRAICRDTHMPTWSAVYRWVNADKDFALRVSNARRLGADAIAEDILSIADTPQMGENRESETGMKVKRADMLGHRKLQIETRLKLLAKWCPKSTATRLHWELTGADGGRCRSPTPSGRPRSRPSWRRPRPARTGTRTMLPTSLTRRCWPT